MSLRWIVVLALGSSMVPTARAQDSVDPLRVEALERAAAERRAQRDHALETLRGTWLELEAGLSAPEPSARLRQEADLARVLEPVLAAANTASDGGRARGALKKIRDALAKELPAALGRLEVAPLPHLAGYLEQRMREIWSASSDPKEVLTIAPATLAQSLLSEVSDSSVPFVDRWDSHLAGTLVAALAFQAAERDATTALAELEVAKDPPRRFQLGAPDGFARVPAGTYIRRCTRGHAAGVRKADKRFTLRSDVFVGLHEVTNAAYRSWLMTMSAEARLEHIPADDRSRPLWVVTDAGPAYDPLEENFPVVGIRLASAALFARSLDRRLPTEDEWAAAASGPKTLAFPWGNEWRAGCANDAAHGIKGAVAVGSFPLGRGPFGHFDLAGNVAEWTVTDELGKSFDFEAPEDPYANVVVRGGSFLSPSLDIGTGWVGLLPAAHERNRSTGFRLAADPKD